MNLDHPSKNFARYTRITLRRHLVPLLLVAVLFAGLAEASHFHRDELGQRGEAHVQCLLCLHSAGGAGTPHMPAVLRTDAVVRVAPTAERAVGVESTSPASYDARGPPTV